MIRATNNHAGQVRVCDDDELLFIYKHRVKMAEIRKATTSKHLEALKIEFWLRNIPWSEFVRVFNVDEKHNKPVIKD